MNAVLEALAAQDGVYTLETVTPQGERAYETDPLDHERRAVVRRSGSAGRSGRRAGLQDHVVHRDRRRLLPRRTPQTRHRQSRSRRRPAKARHTTIYGALAAILDARMKQDAGQVTLQNCDNLRSNGDRFQGRHARVPATARRDRTARLDVDDNTACPNSMVDRITPRPTPDVRERVQAATGFDDRAPVMGEAFIQWVIEDHFMRRTSGVGKGRRGDWSTRCCRTKKPRSASSTRRIAASRGRGRWSACNYIHEGTLDPEIRTFAVRLRHRRRDSVPHAESARSAKYRDVVLERFGNPYIQDTNQRVAADGFSKLPGFIAPTLAECFARERRSERRRRCCPRCSSASSNAGTHGKLPYAYQDGVMDPAVAHGFFTAADPLKAFAADKLLWGSMAQTPELESRVARGAWRASTSGSPNAARA